MKITVDNMLTTVAEVKISYTNAVKPSLRPKIDSSKDAFIIFSKVWKDLEYIESVKILLLNRSNKVLGVASISIGSTTGSIIDVKVLLQHAIKANACSFILAHNHPSGNLKPSDHDLAITTKIKEACKYMDISLLDHLILVPEEKYYSFADEGII